MAPLARSTLVLVFLWWAGPTTRHEPMLLAAVGIQAIQLTTIPPRCDGSGRGSRSL